MKQLSDLVRDMTDPGWREREAEMHRRLMEAVQPYPTDDVAVPCVCGSWPGGKCFRCPVIRATHQRMIIMFKIVGIIISILNVVAAITFSMTGDVGGALLFLVLSVFIAVQVAGIK